jgi:hypothetical protein
VITSRRSRSALISLAATERPRSSSSDTRQIFLAGEKLSTSMLCEALAQDLQASDCLVSRWDPLRSVTAGVAGFTRTPERWRLFGGEFQLDRYPVTLAVLNGGQPYTTWISDPTAIPPSRSCCAARPHRRPAARLDAPVPYLVEVWSDRRSGVFTASRTAAGDALVREASRQLGPR